MRAAFPKLLALAVAVVLAATAAVPVSAQVDLAPLLKRGDFNDIKLSPTGEFYAATVPLEDRTTLVVIRRADGKPTMMFALGKDTHIGDFDWVNPTRLVLAIAQKSGFLDEPQPTGELYGLDADGGGSQLLVGQRRAAPGFATRIRQKEVEAVAATLIDDLSGDDKHVLVAISPFTLEAQTRVELMDVYSGRRVLVSRGPVTNARFLNDHAGVVRFAVGAGTDNVSKLFHRPDADSDWKLVNDEAASHRVEWPMGFAADNMTAYLRVEQATGPDAVVAMDTATGARTVLKADTSFDPAGLIGATASRSTPIGIHFLGDTARNVFFDDASADTRLYRSLEASFPGQSVTVSSATSDGQLLLLDVGSPGNPGDFYLFDVKTKEASHLLSRRQWLDPAKMATVRPIAFKARDGLSLHGFLTLPPGSDGKALPMVVMPHGGPIGIFDKPGFDDDAQILAHAGYVVLQVNFRGSGNFGRAFQQAGAGEWGGRMQDDITDATRWTVAQGIADGKRVCIHGASYGGYAALMGAAREPDLYRCAAGYVGVYDLELMHSQGSHGDASTQTWMNQWVGERGKLDALSPVKLAASIKVPVFLAAGGEDKVAPIEHTERMEKALRKANVPVESMYASTEGHGFYTDANRREYYQRLLAFLARHIGGQTAK